MWTRLKAWLRRKMKKNYILLCILCGIFFISCVSSIHSKLSKSDFTNLDIDFEEIEKEDLLKVTIYGKILDSALSVESYKIKYDKNTVYIDVDRRLKYTGIAIDYYIQFLMNKNIKEIYIGKSLFWTSSVEAYFNSEKMTFPVNYENSTNYKSINIGKETELSEQEQNDVRKFSQYILKYITTEKCKVWNEKSVGFNISKYGIYKDGDKKYFIISVDAYSENQNIYDKIERVGKNTITVLHNVLMFDYDNYKELGWMF